MAKRDTTKFNSNKQEKRIAKEIGGRTTIASGSLYFQKADVRTDKFLLEAKTTAKDYYSLSIATWRKIKSQALKDNLRIPLMCIDLENGKNSLAIISIHDFLSLGMDLLAQYLGNPVPTTIEAKSTRINTNFIYEPFSQEVVPNQHPCFRRDIKFVGQQSPSDNFHLVILPWEDFLKIIGKINM